MATITFHTNIHNLPENQAGDEPTLIDHTAGTGLGFFGGNFGISVPVNQWQKATYVTNAAGTDEGVQVSNIRYNDDVSVRPSGSVVQEVVTIGNSGIPNYQAPLNIRFEHTEDVSVVNCRLRIFDRSDIDNGAVGVTTQVYEVRHPNPKQNVDYHLEHRGIDNHGYVTFIGGDSPSDMSLTASPGASGLNTSSAAEETLPEFSEGLRNWKYQEGAAHRSSRHDWFLALSASPDSVGSKTDYGLYFTLEYM